MREQILAAYDKGFGAEAIARMLKVDIANVISVIGVDVAASDNGRRSGNVADSDKEVSNDELRAMARQTLASLIDDMQHNPSAFKPNEIIAACREALDRTEGKAAQTIAVESKATVTHDHIISIPPDEAYRLLLGGAVVDITSKPASRAVDIIPHLADGGG